MVTLFPIFLPNSISGSLVTSSDSVPLATPEYGWWEWQPKGIPPQLVEWLKMWGQQYGRWDREDGFLLTLSDALITTNAEAELVIYKRLPQLINRLSRIPIAAQSTEIQHSNNCVKDITLLQIPPLSLFLAFSTQSKG